MNDTLAPEFWLVIGGLLVVFVLPAVAILLVRTRYDKVVSHKPSSRSPTELAR